MNLMKLFALRSACVLAVACGLAVAADASAQSRDKAGQPQASKATKARADKQKAAPRSRKQVQAKGKSKQAKPVAANSRSRPATANSKSKPAASAKAASTPPARAVARRPQAPLPPPVAWVPPPLGPERFYPHGIPELRPEFLHPERPLPVEQAATRAPSLGGQPEWLP
ncbi:hypothetical protein EZ313_11405 [Ramlibacter henchirensis]|uniref:Histone n=1 Tax=Ramlibacter henchirensis TaxID=204072 RepID=A0A4Z0C6E0_9BURK|nr:hypothetical protein [Ramlibacter henchirensis]TFZ07183.1 hypothetical protein EZ313_11405 [Ramlibacter henchirensis]